MALVFCCCYVIYILFMAFSIGMLILIYMAHSWIGTLFKRLKDSLEKGFPHSLALYPPSTTPAQAPSILPHHQILSFYLERKMRKGTEELEPTTALAWELQMGFVRRKGQRFSKDGYETESFCGNFSLVILAHLRSLEGFLSSFEKGIRDRSLKVFHAPGFVCLCSSSSLVSCSLWAPASSISETCLNILSALCQNCSLVSPG